MREYQAYLLRDRKLEPRTVKLHVSALRFFFVKTRKRRCLLDDIPYPKVPRRLPNESSGHDAGLSAGYRAALAPTPEAVTRPPFEVADIIRQYGTRFIETHRAWLTAQHLRVLRAIAHCRTAALGAQLDRCVACGRRVIRLLHLCEPA